MNAVHVKLFTLLVVKGRAVSARPAAVACCDSRFHRTAFQFFRTMATIRDNFQETRQPPGPKKAKQKEPLRHVKTKESRNKRGDLHGPATVYLQVVGAGSRDSPATLYVFSEFNRYFSQTSGVSRSL